ncbi:hypothetical protein GE253_25135 [Niveispirillum sp. SYP-B3756]|uniref:trypco2 family protein n=1 Tax=Niveispirillum sp. SYP-B3756 TaxID=2662178 RepID=UPI00129197D5|nr:trypco2 family protein [Niveispirillum sp. SYP-B3756]MQP68601.1 hypothetical protein [Niveispirillum sp. SYP-B3756]
MNVVAGQSVGIADAIDTLRKELAEAINRGDGEELRFKVNGIELELTVACEISGNGKASFKVFGIGGEVGGSAKGTNTHKIKLMLEPTDKEGKKKDTLVRESVDDFPSE